MNASSLLLSLILVTTSLGQTTPQVTRTIPNNTNFGEKVDAITFHIATYRYL